MEITDSYYKPDELEIIKRYLNLPSKPFDYNIRYPGYINTFVNTTIDYNKATFGRVLFYDKNLSSDRSVSCASCHKQAMAFSDNVAFSAGAEGKFTTRNSLALGSVINFRLYYGGDVFNGVPFFWITLQKPFRSKEKNTGQSQ
ncbi:MAG: cytochrome-c peroxidase [Saprospiraceae bacterium]|nr:cytochrome-c peroxidase [Saprospiraceae bacterium]